MTIFRWPDPAKRLKRQVLPIFSSEPTGRHVTSTIYEHVLHYSWPGRLEMAGEPCHLNVLTQLISGASYDVRLRDIPNGVTIVETTALTNTDEILVDLGTLSGISEEASIWTLSLRVADPGEVEILLMELCYP